LFAVKAAALSRRDLAYTSVGVIVRHFISYHVVQPIWSSQNKCDLVVIQKRRGMPASGDLD
jgi:hypothetical protein